MGNRSAKKTKRVICPPGCIPDSIPVPPKPKPIICPPGCIPAPVQEVTQLQVPQPLTPPPQQILIQTPVPQSYPHSQQIYTQTIDSQIIQLTPPPPQNVQIVQSSPMQVAVQNTTVDHIAQQQQNPQQLQTQYIVLRPSSNNNPCPPGCVPIVTMSNASHSRSRSSKNSKIRSSSSESN